MKLRKSVIALSICLMCSCSYQDNAYYYYVNRIDPNLCDYFVFNETLTKIECGGQTKRQAEIHFENDKILWTLSNYELGYFKDRKTFEWTLIYPNSFYIHEGTYVLSNIKYKGEWLYE